MKTEQPEWLQVVREKVETLRYGVVQIVVHDARVTVIERTEKTRFADLPPNLDRPGNLEDNQSHRASHRTTGDRSL